MPLRRLFSPTPARSPRSIERDHVELPLADGRTLQVLRVRDPRAKRIKLAVDERGPRLTLPWRASLRAGQQFLIEHRGWLAAQWDAIAVQAAPIASLQPGVDASLPLRGESMPLRWQAGRSRRIETDGDGLLFHVLQSDLEAGSASPALRRVLRDFYLAEARADVGRWLPRYLPGLPRPPLRISFKVMRSQWGSLAANGAMALDLSLVLAPPDAFEYVLVHELCHLIHHDHSPAFWHAVEQRCPQWRIQRDWFRAEGRGLKAQLQGLLVGEG